MTTTPLQITDRRMRSRRHTRLLAQSALALAMLPALAVVAPGAMPAGASGAPGSEPTGVAPPATPGEVLGTGMSLAGSEVDPQAAAARAAQLGIPVAEAARRLGQEQVQGERAVGLETSLRGRTGGSYLDDSGNLVVTTLDASGDTIVRKAGAKAKRVDDSAARLDTIMRRLNQHAERHGAGSVQGWYVDVVDNSVVVTLTEGATDQAAAAIEKLAKSFGASVEFETAPAERQPAPADALMGGHHVTIPTGGSCSVGFNTVDAANRHVVLTAGHCVTTAGTVSRNGYWVGSTRSARFPGKDYGTFWNAYPSYWVPGPWVTKYNGTYVNVRGSWVNPPVGATVCKSGRTTGYTCGTIRALNQTVTYRGGHVLYGLVRHNACVEPGDSGGANISAGAYALGLTSGAASVSLTDTRCLAKVGQESISYYQPVGEALAASGLRLLATG